MARLRSRVPTSLSVRNVQAIPRAGLALSSLGVLKKGSHRGGAGADMQYRRAWPHRHPRGVQPSRQKWRGSGIRARHDALQPPLWRLRPQTKSLRRSDREGAFLCDQGAARQLRYVRRTENRSFRTCITRRRCADRRSVRCGKRSVERDGRTLPIRRDQPGAGNDVWLRRWTPCRWHICEIVASSLRRFQRVREQARTDRSLPLVARVMVIAEVPLLLDRKVGDLHRTREYADAFSRRKCLADCARDRRNQIG